MFYKSQTNNNYTNGIWWYYMYTFTSEILNPCMQHLYLITQYPFRILYLFTHIQMEKPVLNASFQDFWCTNINNHLICFEKDDKYIYLKAKKSLHRTQMLVLKHIFHLFRNKSYVIHIRKNSKSTSISKKWGWLPNLLCLC